MANKYVMAKWYKSKLDYNKQYQKEHKNIIIYLQEKTYNSFKSICNKLGMTPKELILKEIDKQNAE